MASFDTLTIEQASIVRRANALLQRGDARGAAEEVAPLIAGGYRDPDALMTYARACASLRVYGEAVGAMQAAVAAVPGRADLWSNLGALLSELGRHDEALAALEQALAIGPREADLLQAIGIAAMELGDLVRSREALAEASSLAPESGPVWEALARAELQDGALEQSEAHFRKGLSLAPGLQSARHNLAVTLRKLERPGDALEELERALASGLTAPESLTLRGHLLAELGRHDDAIAAYRAVLADHPAHLDAHETLARLLPQLGRAGEALDAYWKAVAKCPSAELYRSAMAMAREFRQADAMLALADEAIGKLGTPPDFLTMRGLALAMGDASEGLKVLEPLADGGYETIRGHCAYYRLMAGDVRAAEAHALRATEVNSFDQPAWAYLTIIWRLLGDPREAWLADYERLVMPLMIAPPAGFRDIGEFLAPLADELIALHVTRHHPAEQSLRGGTQTRGSLFDKRTPMVRALVGRIQAQTSEVLAALPDDPSHPFLSRNSGRFAVAGSWSVRLSDGGFHVHHIHHSGWLSSALYIELPPEIGESAGSEASPGALVFGVPDSELGLDLSPRRVETPEPGKLVLFPSYFWHGTVPFHSRSPRLTVAFDALPA